MLVASSAPEDLFWSLTSWKGQTIANWRHFEVSKLSTQTMNFCRLQLRRSTLVRRYADFSFRFRAAMGRTWTSFKRSEELKTGDFLTNKNRF
jgi:hypothetical protein